MSKTQEGATTRPIQRRQVLHTAAALGAAAATGAGWAQAPAAPSTLNVIAFGGGVNWPIWVAQERGFFARQGLAVNLQFTPNSVELMQGLVGGRFDIAMAAIDNLVGYMEDQGEAPLPVVPGVAPGAPPELFAFLGNQRGMLRVVAQPEVKTWADLRGQSVAVDALTTGFAFVLYRMMEMGGLATNDVRLERLGATPMRVQALAEKRTAASIINAPLEAPLMARGYTRLGDATEALGAYQGTVGMAHRPWVRTANNEARLQGYTRAWVEAMDWLTNPANRDEALAIYMRGMRVEQPAAEGAYRLLLGNPREGLNPRGQLDLDGIRTVLRLRNQFGTPKKEIAIDPTRYIDERYWRAAIGG
jgi:ABC-type nitrate/sulfonate/bicarbonate transport system substrate-binding protein